MTRTLVLKSETLTDLTTEELQAVAGGNTPRCATQDCYTVGFTCFLSFQGC